MPNHLDKFLTLLDSSIPDNSFAKLTLGSPRDRDGPRKILIKPVALAKGDQLCFVYRHATKDVTKMWPVAEGLALVRTLLGTDFFSANLFTTANDIELVYTEKRDARLRIGKPTHTAPPSRQHNRSKKRPIASQGTPYLALLGVTNKDGAVKKGMESKYRQINKFIEIVDGLLRSSSLGKAASIAVLDMGCGKGYLTFAMYDYLTGTLKKHASVTGVEVRKELVDFCNGVALCVGFADLRFECGSIQDFAPGRTDVLIALHACDTATDEALFKAIQAGGKALVLRAPYGRMELRPRMRCALPGLERLLKYGILEERQAELLTDGLRALLLEAFGYKTSVFEFIATEHTSKNIMIAGVKKPKPPDRQSILSQIDSLKKAFGIDSQRLEALLKPEI